jgi:hypothetical protein
MTDEKKPDEGADEKDKLIEKLNGQVENLNKGIGTYRDEAKAAKETADKATATAAEALAKLGEFEKLFQKKEAGVELTEEEEKKFAAYAKKNNLATKADIAAQRAEAQQGTVKAFEDQAVSEFLEQNPEYDDDEKWKEVMTEFALYRPPTTIAGYRALLNRIHKDLTKAAGDDAQARARAAIINRSKLGLGGGRQSASEDEAEAKIDALHKKYPHLSRDQIVERLSEIDKLPAKKTK